MSNRDAMREPHKAVIPESVPNPVPENLGMASFVDNRPEAVTQRKLQEMANDSTQVKQSGQSQTMANDFIAKGPIQRKKEQYWITRSA